jgi:hypothetical protein
MVIVRWEIRVRNLAGISPPATKTIVPAQRNKHFIKTLEFNMPSTGPNQISTTNNSKRNFTSTGFEWIYVLYVC